MPDTQSSSGGPNSPPSGAGGGRHASRSRSGERNPGSPLRAVGRLIGCLFAIASLRLVSACGVGTDNFDGGHIPIGGGTAATNVVGAVFDAEQYTTPVANATVVVTNTSETGARSMQTTTTAADGTFAVSAIPDVPNTNVFVVSVTPPPGSSRIGQQFTINVNAGQEISVLASLPLLSFNESTVGSVTLLQQTYSVHSGDTIEIAAELLDTFGNPLPVLPSLIFIGATGSLQANGLFTSTATGTGSVSAFWYNGAQQLQSTPATITSSPSVSHVPPPAPR